VADVDVYLEIGAKRVFACAVDWPGWCRSGPDEAACLEALTAYVERYRAALAAAGTRRLPPSRPKLRVGERVRGDATTDFGAPSKASRLDDRPFDGKESRRLIALLGASWSAFDSSVRAAGRRKLSTGPRGGGRQVEAIREHVLEADRAYLPKIGGRFKRDAGSSLDRDLRGVREAVVAALNARAAGEPAPPGRGKTWPPRYHVRRSAWHALDHAWEIEDRLG